MLCYLCLHFMFLAYFVEQLNPRNDLLFCLTKLPSFSLFFVLIICKESLYCSWISISILFIPLFYPFTIRQKKSTFSDFRKKYGLSGKSTEIFVLSCFVSKLWGNFQTILTVQIFNFVIFTVLKVFILGKLEVLNFFGYLSLFRKKCFNVRCVHY